MIVYIAGAYSRLEEFQGYKRELEEMGFQVPARWLLGEHRMIDGQPGPQNRGFALDDWHDIHVSDVFLAFTEEPGSGSGRRGGRHVEFGIAAALGHSRWKAWGRRWPALHVVGPRENVFHYLPDVLVHLGWEEAREAMECRARWRSGDVAKPMEIVDYEGDRSRDE